MTTVSQAALNSNDGFVLNQDTRELQNIFIIVMRLQYYLNKLFHHYYTIFLTKVPVGNAKSILQPAHLKVYRNIQY